MRPEQEQEWRERKRRAREGGESKPNGRDRHSDQPAFQIVQWQDLDALPQPEPLIKHLLDRGGLSVIFGPSNSGKTFFALDLALHVALGCEWRGLRTRKGAVLYIAAEAGRSIAKRLKAFRYHHEIETTGVEFYVMRDSLDMCQSPAPTGQLITQIAEGFPGVGFELIVVDTLARAMGGGNENAPDDMGALIASCDRLREKTGAHVSLVHHTGKNEQRAERGHSALRAAVDTAIDVTHDEASSTHTATVQKQRDGECGRTFAFKLRRVEIGKDEDNEPITSCVVDPTDEGTTARKVKVKPLKAEAKLALEELHNCIAAYGDDPIEMPGGKDVPAGVRGARKADWRARLEKKDIINVEGNPREELKRIANSLKEQGLIGEWDGVVWPVPRRKSPSQICCFRDGGVTS